MLNIVLFGPPGAGKGTQSAKLIEKYKLTHISTGDLFRKHLKEGTELGKLAQKYMDEGQLVPDEVVIGMVEEKIRETKDSTKGYIFDGFPRTVKQAEALDYLLQKHEEQISKMIALDVPEQELRSRLHQRAALEGRTDDQDESKISKRIQEYNEKTLPVANYYLEQEKFAKIHGVGNIDEIFSSIVEKIDSISENQA
jgi:adenylate kinase